LLSLGPAFSEAIARSLVDAIWHENLDHPDETDVRTAAGLTMLEAFHPIDQLECMLAAQGVAAHCAIMDNFRCAAAPDTPPLVAIKFRANAVSLNRMFCTNLRELLLLQAKPLPPRPGRPSEPSGDAPLPGGPPDAPEAAAKQRVRKAAKTASPAEAAPLPEPEPECPLAAEPLMSLEDLQSCRRISRPVRTAPQAISKPMHRSSRS
jgi:hypothetical protein